MDEFLGVALIFLVISGVSVITAAVVAAAVWVIKSIPRGLMWRVNVVAESLSNIRE